MNMSNGQVRVIMEGGRGQDEEMGRNSFHVLLHFMFKKQTSVSIWLENGVGVKMWIKLCEYWSQLWKFIPWEASN